MLGTLCLLLLSCTPKSLTCEEKATQLVPESVYILKDEDRWILSQTNKLMNNTWKDGTLLLATETAYLEEEENGFRIRDDDKFAFYESGTLHFNATLIFNKIEGTNKTVKGVFPDGIRFSLFEVNQFSILDSTISGCAEQ